VLELEILNQRFPLNFVTRTFNLTFQGLPVYVCRSKSVTYAVNAEVIKEKMPEFKI